VFGEQPKYPKFTSYQNHTPNNQQIADQLFVDVSTISSHRKNMLAKYDVPNTAQLIKLAITEKLI
jgi:DNA-binding CsgD family transcriptional regulator